MAETEQTIELLRKAIALRIDGATWQQVADVCGRTMETCKNWPVTHRDTWAKMWNEISPTIENIIREKGQRALHVLERLSENSDDEKVRAAAAAKLVDALSKTLTQKTDTNLHGDGIKIVFCGDGISADNPETE